MNTHLKEQVEPVIQYLKESSSMLKQSQELFEANSEKEKRNKKIDDKNSRRTRVNTKPQKETNYSVLEKTALSILKQHTASIQSSDLKKDIQARTGMKILNMTTFMQRLMKQDPQIEKPYRGQYIYINENESKNEELMLEEKGADTPQENTNHEPQGNELVLNQDLETIE